MPKKSNSRFVVSATLRDMEKIRDDNEPVQSEADLELGQLTDQC